MNNPELCDLVSMKKFSNAKALAVTGFGDQQAEKQRLEVVSRPGGEVTAQSLRKDAQIVNVIPEGREKRTLSKTKRVSKAFQSLVRKSKIKTSKLVEVSDSESNEEQETTTSLSQEEAPMASSDLRRCARRALDLLGIGDYDLTLNDCLQSGPNLNETLETIIRLGDRNRIIDVLDLALERVGTYQCSLSDGYEVSLHLSEILALHWGVDLFNTVDGMIEGALGVACGILRMLQMHDDMDLKQLILRQDVRLILEEIIHLLITWKVNLGMTSDFENKNIGDELLLFSAVVLQKILAVPLQFPALQNFKRPLLKFSTIAQKPVIEADSPFTDEDLLSPMHRWSEKKASQMRSKSECLRRHVNIGGSPLAVAGCAIAEYYMWMAESFGDQKSGFRGILAAGSIASVSFKIWDPISDQFSLVV